jgi:hypothetical protein
MASLDIEGLGFWVASSCSVGSGVRMPT